MAQLAGRLHSAPGMVSDSWDPALRSSGSLLGVFLSLPLLLPFPLLVFSLSKINVKIFKKRVSRHARECCLVDRWPAGTQGLDCRDQARCGRGLGMTWKENSPYDVGCQFSAQKRKRGEIRHLIMTSGLAPKS